MAFESEEQRNRLFTHEQLEWAKLTKKIFGVLFWWIETYYIAQIKAYYNQGFIVPSSFSKFQLELDNESPR